MTWYDTKLYDKTCYDKLSDNIRRVLAAVLGFKRPSLLPAYKCKGKSKRSDSEKTIW